MRRTRTPAPHRAGIRVLRALIAVLVLALSGVLGVAWYFSGLAIAVGSHRFEPVTTVLSIAPDGRVVRLSDGPGTRLSGVAALEWQGGYGRLGEVLGADADSVTRRFTPVAGAPAVGAPAGIDSGTYQGDPRSALGLSFEQVTPRSDVGDLPTWYLPGSSAAPAWVVFVHGHDSSRQESLRYLGYLHDRGLSVLVPSYRNDAGAPASPDGHDHLGGTEWRDVEATVRWALDHGAPGVMLFGWSMGGAVSLQFVDRSPLRTAVRGLVLDSPVTDWRDVFAHQGAERGLPAALTGVAEFAIERRIGIDLDRFDWVARAGELRQPILLVHSPQDTYVTDGPSRALARARPDLVTDLVIPGAGHTRGWNVDPQRYQAVLGPWLREHAG